MTEHVFSGMEPVFGICFFLVMWIAIVYLLSFISGWHKVAKLFRADDQLPQETYRFHSAKIGTVDYSGCLAFGTNEEGLRLSVLFPFRPGHAPLFFPRSTISIAPANVLILKELHVTLTIADCPSFKLTISKKLAQKLFPEQELLQE